jgi:putative transposase
LEVISIYILKKILGKLYQKKNSQIKQCLHIQANELINMNYHTIIIGQLKIKKLMLKKENKYNKISRSFHRSNINQFLLYLKYKCEENNINLIMIDERWTTQLNCLTGKLFKEKIKLKDRTVKLNNQIIIDRDLNSAINILKRYLNNHLSSIYQNLDIKKIVSKYNFKKF